jgi:hypothetical protein
MNITIGLAEDQATIVFWALYEKHLQLETRVKEFRHIMWPSEAISAAAWEANKLKEVMEIMREAKERPTSKNLRQLYETD